MGLRMKAVAVYPGQPNSIHLAGVELTPAGDIMLSYTPNNGEAHQRLLAKLRHAMEHVEGGMDASFFPSSSSVNPSLTIIANALRVADHLRERLTVDGRPSTLSESSGGIGPYSRSGSSSGTRQPPGQSDNCVQDDQAP